jgi:hypothetical protein
VNYIVYANNLPWYDFVVREGDVGCNMFKRCTTNNLKFSKRHESLAIIFYAGNTLTSYKTQPMELFFV